MWIRIRDSGNNKIVYVYRDNFSVSATSYTDGTATASWRTAFADGGNALDTSENMNFLQMTEYPYSLARGIIGLVRFYRTADDPADDSVRKEKLFYTPFFSDGSLNIGGTVVSDDFDYNTRTYSDWQSNLVISPSQSMTKAGLNALTGVTLVLNKPYKLTAGLERESYNDYNDPNSPNWITMAGMPADEEYYCLGAYGNYLLAARRGPTSYDPLAVNNLAGSVIARTFTGADIAAGLKNEAPPVNSGQVGPRPSQNTPTRIFHDGNRLYVNDRGGDADEFGDISWSLVTV